MALIFSYIYGYVNPGSSTSLWPCLRHPIISINISFLNVFQYFTINLQTLITLSGVDSPSNALILITGIPKHLTISEL